MLPCTGGRAGPPPWYVGVEPPRWSAPSAPTVAHATATKEDPGRWQDPNSSLSAAPWKPPPSAIPTEPSPGHCASRQELPKCDGHEDAGPAFSLMKLIKLQLKLYTFNIIYIKAPLAPVVIFNICLQHI